MLRLSSKSRINNSITTVGGRELPFTLNASAFVHTDGNIEVIHQQSDGKILIGGVFDFYGLNNNASPNLIRLNPDLTYDPSFVVDYRVGLDRVLNTVYAIHQQSDGKILVGGDFTTIGLGGLGNLIRLDISGSIDTDFNQGTGLNDGPVESITQQSDGKILVTGQFFNTYSGSAASRLVRINLSGSIDTDFNIGAGLSASGRSIIQQSDGKILIVGAFATYSGSTVNRIVRLNPSGTIDTSFNTGTGLSGTTYSIVQQSDGKILIGGAATTYSGSTINRIARLNTNGTIDTTYNIGSGIASGDVRTIAIQPDNKILKGGATFTSYSGSTVSRIIRTNSDGTLDTDFKQGAGFNGQVDDIKIQANNTILIAGAFTTYSGSIEGSNDGFISLNLSGSINTEAITSCTYTATCENIYQQLDGKILVAGNFRRINNKANFRIARLNSDFTVDTSFNTGAGLSGTAEYITQQSDGKILAVGFFTTYSGSTVNSIVRLNLSGTIDTDFNTGTGFNGTLYSIEQQSDGKILVGGSFTTYSGSSVNRIVRLNSSGSIDSSFNVGSGANFEIFSTLIQPDNKIVIAGAFTTYSGSTQRSIVRINPLGTIDSDFKTGTGFSTIDNSYSAYLQTDGKIIVAGDLSTYSGSIPTNNLVRINQSGSLDINFNQGLGFDATVNTVIQQSDGKLLAGGDFNRYNIADVKLATRFNIDSNNIDTSFKDRFTQVTTQTLGGIKTIKQQSDGKLLFGGYFAYHNSTLTGGIVRLTTSSLA